MGFGLEPTRPKPDSSSDLRRRLTLSRKDSFTVDLKGKTRIHLRQLGGAGVSLCGVEEA